VLDPILFASAPAFFTSLISSLDRDCPLTRRLDAFAGHKALHHRRSPRRSHLHDLGQAVVNGVTEQALLAEVRFNMTANSFMRD
jgi:hypothetical protein